MPIEPTEDCVKQWLSSSIHTVFQGQPKLWNWNLGEPARVAEIFFDLRCKVPPPWNVDLEWNREGQLGATKKLPNVESKTYGTPDLIIHRRGDYGRENNLLVVEFKNKYSAEAEKKDKAKVLDWMDRYGYQFGAVVSLRRARSGSLDPQSLWANWETGKPAAVAWHP
ncbi:MULTISPECIES: hypothetical protein [Arthrobacter]|uniref:Uncharacterized protein n=1 Tax=Arthrobacter terricola TaxID=2547396 RepID=A0A4R5KJF8_9MICC|nr:MULTISPECIES: hypothetical protein [Arthrobacter]MBT8161462.1 hypothetical protein [Arthrobacter sp. GN70]TDF95633.1 hypothetical protein E1809_11440 [Arthrobacter terricola]